jgi:hypothetical protein
MPENKTPVTPKEFPQTGDRRQTDSYLNHGADSLVAMDNPDDSQLGAEPASAKQGQQQ